jgi:chemotaxis protein MotB
MSAVPQNAASKAQRKPHLPTPDEHAVAETIEWEDPNPQPRRSGGSWLVTITALLLASGLGYISWQQWQARGSAVAALGKTSAQLQTLTKEHSQALQNASDQQKLAAEQKQLLEQNGSELGDVKAKLGAAEARLRELETQSEALNAHVAEFKALTKQFQRMIDSGKLQVNFRRGRMIVELPAAVLFASGSADVSQDGRQALQEIAKILKKVPGKRFMVGGHTDDVPIGKNATYSSNWSLSAARAVMVTEELIQAGLRANRLTAAGYSEFDPIATNGTDKGRTKNRRIEIVLEPDLASVPGALADLKDTPAAKASAKSSAKPATAKAAVSKK